MSTLTVWRFVDGTPGHENQSAGLIAAIEKREKIQVHEIKVSGLPCFIFQILFWIFRKKPRAFPTSKPDFIIGAGHKTHMPIFLARSLCGGKAVVLMRPSLPMSFYDLVVAPQHDHVPHRKNVIEINGVLNAIKYSNEKDPIAGLMLIGGESAHYTWDSQFVIDQINQVVGHDATVKWTLTTSRRTPENFLQELRNQCDSDRVTIVPCEKTDQQWMFDHYKKSKQIWVTPDSVSMVYEALSSGAAVYVFSLAYKENGQTSRVVRGLQQLIDHSIALTYDLWQSAPDSKPKREYFNESDRVAQYVLEQLQ